MRKPASYTTIAVDLFWVQLTWTFIAAAILLIVDVVRFIFGKELDSFYSSTYVAGNIYMLVIGIILIGFLKYFVELGVTRRNYFVGGVIASLGLSVVIPVLMYIVSLIEKLIASQFASFVLREDTLKQVDIDIGGNIIGELMMINLLTPFIDPNENVVLSLALFSLHLFVFYLIGWLIGAAFIRLGVIGGIFFIIVGIALNGVKDSMIRIVLDMPLYQTFSVLENVSEVLALPLVVAVVLVTILFIHLLTKRAPIKI